MRKAWFFLAASYRKAAVPRQKDRRVRSHLRKAEKNRKKGEKNTEKGLTLTH